MTIEGQLRLNGDERIAIVASRWNHIITDRLVEGAKDSFARHGGKEPNLDIVLVPGAFELPMGVQKVLQTNKYVGLCALGTIIRGSTPHFDYISAEATKGIASMSLKYNIPVMFGVLTTDTIEQAIERAGSKAGNKGFEAMSGLIEMIDLYKTIEKI
jgi:6,7-dimethyl-8-ribityllumazine synthase